jgi:hypothetical protein
VKLFAKQGKKKVEARRKQIFLVSPVNPFWEKSCVKALTKNFDDKILQLE